MTTKTYNAIVLYSQADLELARRLKAVLFEHEVSCWFADENLLFGEGIQTGISRALAQSQYALICIGQHGLGQFQEGEWNTVYTAARAGEIVAIPIYYGQGSTIGPSTVDDLFLRGLKGCDLRMRLDGNPQLEMLIERLGGRRPGFPETPKADAVTARAATPAAGDDLVGRLAEYARTKGINIFIGPTWPERILPSAEEVALDMLNELLPMSEAERETLSGAPLVPPEQASLALALRDGQSEDRHDDLVRRFIAPRSLGEPPAYAEVVHVAQALATADTPKGSAIVFTTNIDLALERAFLRQGVAFTRLVFDLAQKEFRETTYEAAVTDKHGRLMLRRDGHEFVERLDNELPDEWEQLCRAEFERSGAKAHISFAEFVQVVERNEIIARYHEVFRTAEPSSLEFLPRGRPLLVKLLGTHTIERTCVISYDQFYRMAGIQGILPSILSMSLSESPSLLLGYNLCEPVFRLLFETILREPFANAKHDRRCAVLQLAEGGATGWNAIARMVGGAIAGGYQNGLEMQIVANQSPADFLIELGKRLARPVHNNWGVFR